MRLDKQDRWDVNLSLCNDEPDSVCPPDLCLGRPLECSAHASLTSDILRLQECAQIEIYKGQIIHKMSNLRNTFVCHQFARYQHWSNHRHLNNRPLSTSLDVYGSNQRSLRN